MGSLDISDLDFPTGDKLDFGSVAGSTSCDLVVRNPTSHPVIYKIKTNAVDRFVVKPHFGLLGPGAEITIHIKVVEQFLVDFFKSILQQRQSGKLQPSFIFQYCVAPSHIQDSDNQRAAFSAEEKAKRCKSHKLTIDHSSEFPEEAVNLINSSTNFKTPQVSNRSSMRDSVRAADLVSSFVNNATEDQSSIIEYRRTIDALQQENANLKRALDSKERSLRKRTQSPVEKTVDFSDTRNRETSRPSNIWIIVIVALIMFLIGRVTSSIV